MVILYVSGSEWRRGTSVEYKLYDFKPEAMQADTSNVHEALPLHTGRRKVRSVYVQAECPSCSTRYDCGDQEARKPNAASH